MQIMARTAPFRRKKRYAARRRPIRTPPSTDSNPYRPPVEEKANEPGGRGNLRKLSKKLESGTAEERLKALMALGRLAKQYRSYRPDVAREALRRLWENPSIMANCMLMGLGATGEDWITWEDLQRKNSRVDMVAFALALPSTIYLGCAAPESITGNIPSLVGLTSFIFLMYATARKIELHSLTNSFLDSILAKN